MRLIVMRLLKRIFYEKTMNRCVIQQLVADNWQLIQMHVARSCSVCASKEHKRTKPINE